MNLSKRSWAPVSGDFIEENSGELLYFNDAYTCVTRLWRDLKVPGIKDRKTQQFLLVYSGILLRELIKDHF